VFFPSLSLSGAGAVTSCILQALTVLAIYVALIIFSEARSGRSILACAALAICLSIIEPITIFSYPNVYFGYIVSNVYHNPTIVALKPFAIATFVSTAALMRVASLSASPILRLAGWSVLSVLAKPNYALCIVPSALLLNAASGLKRVAAVTIAFAPTLILLGWQYLFHYSGAGHTRLVLAPLFVFTCGGIQRSDVGYRFLLSIAFPLALTVLYPAIRRTQYVALAWLSFAVAALFTYMMAELTPSGLDCSGNFAWGTQITLLILFVSSVAAWLREVMELGIRWRSVVCAAILALHLISGVLFYIKTIVRPWPL
jgi:hypothetical protein